MITEPWHLDGPTWAAYAAGRLDPIALAAIDAHVIGCRRCRDGARAQVDPTEQVWRAVQAEISRPRLPWTLRWLRRLGIPDDDLVVLSASDNLRLPWAVAVGAAIACAVLTGSAGGLLHLSQQAWFLLLAPLVPVLAVVAAYDPTDPLRELTTATPYSKLRLALVRTAAALLVAIPVTMGVGLLVDVADLVVVWLLPGLGLTIAALVLLTWATAWLTGVLVSLAWTTTVVVVTLSDHLYVIAGPTGQLAFAVLCIGLATVLVLRTTTLRTLGATR